MVSLPKDYNCIKDKKRKRRGEKKEKKKEKRRKAGTRQATSWQLSSADYFTVLKGNFTHTVPAIQAALHSADTSPADRIHKTDYSRDQHLQEAGRCGPKGVILVRIGIFSSKLLTAA